jgi:hypothetical protein
MAYKKRFFSVPGNSLLESVIALTIISVCLYVAVMVYASVFTPKTAPKFYISRNRMDELFFLMELQNDSVNDFPDANWKVEEEWLNANVKQVTITAKDSLQTASGNSYFILQK